MTLDLIPGLPHVAGRVRHPKRIDPPEGFQRCAEAEDLFFRWEAAWGGETFLGNEPIAVKLFNGGYPLETAELKVSGADAEGDSVFDITVPVQELPRGRECQIEVPTYEVSGPPKQVTVTLTSAEFGPENQ